MSPLLDRMEAKGVEFHRKVRQGYLQQIAADPEHHRRIDATLGEEQVWTSLMAVLHQYSRSAEPRAYSSSFGAPEWY